MAKLGRTDVLARLRETPEFQAFERDFTAVTGLPVLLVTERGEVRAAVRGRVEAALCRVVQGGGGGCDLCRQTRAALVGHVDDGPVSAACPAGLMETVLPLRVGGDVIGFVQTGQVFVRDPDEAGFRRLRRWLVRHRVDVDLEELRRRYFGARRLSREQYAAMLGLLQLATEHLGEVGSRLLEAQEARLSPAVAKACRHLRNHLTEPVSLAAVARVAGVSRHHFSKVFHREVGMPFIDYVARLRVEQACEVLREPGARVAETALQCGFQSISQFNRTFRRLMGKSPTEFRALEGAGGLEAAGGVDGAAGRRSPVAGVVGGPRVTRLPRMLRSG